MLLESLHIYALVASVVKERGMLTRKQNLLVGLGLPFFVVLCNMCFEFDNYGGQYHCWLQMDTGGCNSYRQKPVLGIRMFSGLRIQILPFFSSFSVERTEIMLAK
jgi:hypothetical protein